MKCRFLQEAEVESCSRYGQGKLIVRREENRRFEKCTLPAYQQCPIYAQHPTEVAGRDRCPYLQTSLMQFCSAASVTKFVPYSEGSDSRCGNGAFRYCDVYLAIEHPETPDTPRADGLAVPSYLFFSPNHLWVDRSEDGQCHIGIDALLSRVLGSVDHVEYLTGAGAQRPAAVLSAGGSDFQILFPNPLRITATNSYLRANPAKLTEDPYRQGWLFEGVDPSNRITDSLLAGADAVEWMARELERLSVLVHDTTRASRDDHAFMADGGVIASGLFNHLERTRSLSVFHEFFSPSAIFVRGQRSSM